MLRDFYANHKISDLGFLRYLRVVVIALVIICCIVFYNLTSKILLQEIKYRSFLLYIPFY